MKITKIEGRRQKAEDRRRETEVRNLFSVVCPLFSLVHRRSPVVRLPSSVSRRRGIALIWTAVSLTVLLLFVALALDAARLFLVATQLHNAADAASLAGAQVVKFNETGARALAIDTAAQNYADGLSVFLRFREPIQPDPWPTTIDPRMQADYDVLIGRWVAQNPPGQRFFPTLYSPNAVMALGRREGFTPEGPPIALLLMPLAKIYTANLRRHAVARCRGATGAGILTLADHPEEFSEWSGSNGDAGLVARGTWFIDLRGFDPKTGKPMLGDIHINSLSFDATKAAFYDCGTSGQIWAAEVTMGGTSNPAPDSSKWDALYGDPSLPFGVVPGQPRIDDPLANLIPPVFTSANIPLDKNKNPYTYTIDNQKITEVGQAFVGADGKTHYELHLTPGYYPGGINVTSGGHRIVLTGGQNAIYEFGGGANGDSGVVINNAAFVEDTTPGNDVPNAYRGVMVYITGDPDGTKTGMKTAYGRLDLGGNAEILITPRGDWQLGADGLPIISGELGVSLWQDRDNHHLAKIAGTSDFLLKGTLYFGYNPLQVEGNAVSCGSQIIAGALDLRGGLDLGVAYDGRNRDTSDDCCLVE